jgi:hypothetical protein
METFIGTISGIIIGGLITVWASRYFYKKSIKAKTLSCFVQYISEILTNIDPEVKNNLEVDFKGQKVESLYQIQFVIANTGDIAIRNIITPLTLEIPNNGTILDANLIDIEPEGREVKLEIPKPGNVSKLNFPLLNSGEFFIVKLLIKGEVPRPEPEKEIDEDGIISLYDRRGYNLFKFQITADDLPPVIDSEPLPRDYSEFRSTYFDKSVIWGGLIFGTISFLLTFVLYNLTYATEDLFIYRFKLFFTNFSFLKLSIIVAWLLTVFIAILAIFIPASEIRNLRPKKKLKFTLPKKHSRYFRPF